MSARKLGHRLGLVLRVLARMCGVLAAIAVAYVLIVPSDPPPSLNEGRAYLFILGTGLAVIGSVAGVTAWLLRKWSGE